MAHHVLSSGTRGARAETHPAASLTSARNRTAITSPFANWHSALDIVDLGTTPGTPMVTLDNVSARSLGGPAMLLAGAAADGFSGSRIINLHIRSSAGVAAALPSRLPTPRRDSGTASRRALTRCGAEQRASSDQIRAVADRPDIGSSSVRRMHAAVSTNVHVASRSTASVTDAADQIHACQPASTGTLFPRTTQRFHDLHHGGERPPALNTPHRDEPHNVGSSTAVMRQLVPSAASVALCSAAIRHAAAPAFTRTIADDPRHRAWSLPPTWRCRSRLIAAKRRLPALNTGVDGPPTSVRRRQSLATGTITKIAALYGPPSPRRCAIILKASVKSRQLAQCYAHPCGTFDSCTIAACRRRC